MRSSEIDNTGKQNDICILTSKTKGEGMGGGK